MVPSTLGSLLKISYAGHEKAREADKARKAKKLAIPMPGEDEEKKKVKRLFHGR